MNWKALTNPISWYEPAVDTIWQLGSKPASIVSPTWKLPSELLGKTQLIWPNSLRWPQATKWVDPIRSGLARYVPLATGEVMQRQETVLMLSFCFEKRRYPIAIDFSDYPQINRDIADESLVYFKMQFDRSGYSPSNVVPGGFIANNCSLYQYIPKLRELSRKHKPTIDVSGRFSLKFNRSVRSQALELLDSQSKFTFCGGGERIRYSSYLKEVANSKVCIDLPGNGGLCFRLVDYFAVGACVVGPQQSAMLHVDIEDGKHMRFCRSDLSDLVDLCEFYLNNENQREQLINGSREFFDKYLHREQLAAYYLHRCFAALR